MKRGIYITTIIETETGYVVEFGNGNRLAICFDEIGEDIFDLLVESYNGRRRNNEVR